MRKADVHYVGSLVARRKPPGSRLHQWGLFTPPCSAFLPELHTFCWPRVTCQWALATVRSPTWASKTIFGVSGPRGTCWRQGNALDGDVQGCSQCRARRLLPLATARSVNASSCKLDVLQCGPSGRQSSADLPPSSLCRWQRGTPATLSHRKLRRRCYRLHDEPPATRAGKQYILAIANLHVACLLVLGSLTWFIDKMRKR